MNAELSKSDRELLKAIYRLGRDGSDVHTGELALKLNLAPGTVTVAVKRLAITPRGRRLRRTGPPGIPSGYRDPAARCAGP